MTYKNEVMLWTILLVNHGSGTGSKQQNLICEAIEKKYPVKLVKAKQCDTISFIGDENTKIMLDYLETLE